jgi:hypothetical protein
MFASRHSGCKAFCRFLDRSPATASADDIRRFQLDWSGAGSPLQSQWRRGGCERPRVGDIDNA